MSRDINPIYDAPLTAAVLAKQQQQDAARYAWFRKAYVDFDDEPFNEALAPLERCYTPEEVDAAIDAELAKAGVSKT